MHLCFVSKCDNVLKRIISNQLMNDYRATIKSKPQTKTNERKGGGASIFVRGTRYILLNVRNVTIVLTIFNLI